MRFERYLLNEFADTKGSKTHEMAITKAFQRKVVPPYSEWPNSILWLRKLGIEEGTKVVSSKRTHPRPIKPDIQVEFNNGSFLCISAKKENYSFIQNWCSPSMLYNIFGKEVADLILDDAVRFANNWEAKDTTKAPLGIAISFGVKKKIIDPGEYSSRPLLDIANLSIDNVRKLITGTTKKNPTNKNYANCLYRINTVPDDIIELLKNLEPISDSALFEIAESLNIFYRPIYYTSNTQMNDIALCVIPKAKKKRNDPTGEIYSWNIFKKMVYWVKAYSKVTGSQVLKELEDNNILLKDQRTNKTAGKTYKTYKKKPLNKWKKGEFFYYGGKRQKLSKPYRDAMKETE
jgi:hypothetical protein